LKLYILIIYLNDEDNKELTYRLALRAARLLGNSVEERQGIFKVLKDLYKYRSKVAHGKNLETLRKSDKERLSNVLDQAPLILKDQSLVCCLVMAQKDSRIMRKLGNGGAN
jgi:hypothetical protein